MRLRVADRILVALAGLLLIACCGAILAQMFFGVDLVAVASRVFSSESFRTRAALIALSLFLLLLGLYCLFVLFRHRRRKDKFILQKNDNGELAISLKALENMVQKCLDQHPEIHVQHQQMENLKDGLLIRLRGSVAGGISIPLTVEALQRQIKQYVTACSGVEVKGIRVQIEASDKDAKDAPFAIEGPSPKPLLKEENRPAAEAEQTVTPAPAPAEVSAAVPEPAPFAAPAPAAEAPRTERPVSTPAPQEMIPEEDDRPLHQRLFSPKEEPCIVPAPPEETNAAAGAEENAAVEIPVAPAAGEETEAIAEPADVPDETASEEMAADGPDETAEAGDPLPEASADHPGTDAKLFSDFDAFVTGKQDQEDEEHEV